MSTNWEKAYDALMAYGERNFGDAFWPGGDARTCAELAKAGVEDPSGQTLKKFKFDCGDSTHESIGFCAAVTAASPEEAVEILEDALPDALSVEVTDPRVDYCTVFFNVSALHPESEDWPTTEDE